MRVSETCNDVIVGQAWILGQYVAFGPAVREMAQHLLNADSRAPDDWLAGQYVSIDDNAIPQFKCHGYIPVGSMGILALQAALR